MTEITVIIKGTEQTYKQKFIVYEPFTWAWDDPVIKGMIDQALANAKIEPEDIKVRGVIQVK